MDSAEKAGAKSERRDLLTVREAAELLRVHPETLRRWTREGRIRLGGMAGSRLRYRRDDLSRWIEGQPMENQDDAPSA